MGAKTRMLVYAEASAREALRNAPQLDRDATHRFAHDLFPGDSVVDWFAFAHWQNGTLIRSLSLSPDDGVMEDIGYQLEGFVDPNLLEPEDVALMRFKRRRPFWKLW